MENKIVKDLRFGQDPNNNYQINAVRLEGQTAEEIRDSVTTDNLNPGTAVWIFDCGTSKTNIN